MCWSKILEVLVQHHLHSFNFYRPHSSDSNDLQIYSFVKSNILGMSPVYRWGVASLFLLLNVLALTRGSFLTHLSAGKRTAFIEGKITHFPFDLLNKLVCGNIYLRLFEITSGKSS